MIHFYFLGSVFTQLLRISSKIRTDFSLCLVEGEWVISYFDTWYVAINQTRMRSFPRNRIWYEWRMVETRCIFSHFFLIRMGHFFPGKRKFIPNATFRDDFQDTSFPIMRAWYVSVQGDFENSKLPTISYGCRIATLSSTEASNLRLETLFPSARHHFLI